MDEPRRPWHRKKRWRAALVALAASMAYTPLLLGDLMYVAGRHGVSGEAAARLIFVGNPTPPTGGPVSQGQWYLMRRYASGKSDSERRERLKAVLADIEAKAAAEGAEAAHLSGLASAIRKKLDDGTRAPFWYRWMAGEKLHDGQPLIFQTRGPLPAPPPGADPPL